MKSIPPPEGYPGPESPRPGTPMEADFHGLMWRLIRFDQEEMWSYAKWLFWLGWLELIWWVAHG